jgi:CheY-like chemotaxis protein
MDLQMPDVDGYRATLEIRSGSGERARTPIVAMSAHAGESDRARALEAGMNDYLSKPISFEEVSALLRKMGLAPPPRSTSPAAASMDAAGGLKPGGGQAIDEGALASLRGFRWKDGSDLSHHLISIFLRDLPARVQGLLNEVSGGNFQRAGEVAHSMRSNAKLLGANALAELCARVETLCRSGQTSTVPELAAEVERECALVEAALRGRIRPH